MFPRGQGLDGHIAHFAGKVLSVIRVGNPLDVQQCIQKPKIVMLQAVNFEPVLIRAHAQVWLSRDVVVHTVDVRERMVYRIVLGFPHRDVGPQ